MFKKGMACLLALTMLGSFSSCACQHEWSEATCENAKMCIRCGEETGSKRGHEWLEATCERPKTCEVCGETIGLAYEHEWLAANCRTPKTCEVCGKTEGGLEPHKYYEGNCKWCNTNDPNYRDYESFGFTNNYGMDMLVEIEGYDFGTGAVRVSKKGPSAYVISEGLIREGQVLNGVFEGLTYKAKWIHNCYTLTNASLEYQNVDWVISERAVSSNKKWVILKTVFHYDSRWFIPNDMIDWSRAGYPDNGDDGTEWRYLK